MITHTPRKYWIGTDHEDFTRVFFHDPTKCAVTMRDHSITPVIDLTPTTAAASELLECLVTLVMSIEEPQEGPMSAEAWTRECIRNAKAAIVKATVGGA